jgi:hypothetical protein
MKLTAEGEDALICKRAAEHVSTIGGHTRAVGAGRVHREGLVAPGAVVLVGAGGARQTLGCRLHVGVHVLTLGAGRARLLASSRVFCDSLWPCP